MKKRISLSTPSITRKEIRYVRRALKSGWLTQLGSDVAKMERNIQEFYQPRFTREIFATSTSNGTTALHLALLALGVGPGDEVIIPGFCYVAVANSVLYCGATPVIVDVDEATWNLDINRIRSALSDKSKVVIAVDNYGKEVDLKPLREILPSRVAILQDSAESFPSNRNNLNSDSADLITISLYANKIVTSGEGGAIVGRPDLIDKINKLKNQSQDLSRKFNHDEIGYNYRITNLQAAIFNAQWTRKTEFLRLRRRVFATYMRELRKNKIIFSMNVDVEDSPWLLTIRLDAQAIEIQRIFELMSASGIDTRPGFTALSQLPYISELSKFNGSVNSSEKLSQSLISLPTYSSLIDKDIKYIVGELSKAIALAK